MDKKSSLNEMGRNGLIVQHKTPDDDLDQYVKYFWTLKNNSDTTTVSILPDGYFDLMVVFREDKLHSVVLIGLSTQAIEYSVVARSTVYAVSFKLSAVEGVLNHS